MIEFKTGGIFFMRKQIARRYFPVIFLLLTFGILIVGCSSTTIKKPVSAPSSPSELTEYYHRLVRYHNRMDGNVPDGSVIFIGDSITQGLCVSAVAPLSVNYGIGGDTTVGVLNRLSIYQSMNRASVIVMAIGINDMARRSNEEILKNYALITDKLPAATPVIFSAVLPLDDEIHPWDDTNPRIKALNAGLKAFCETSSRLHYLDIGNLLVDKKGNLADEYHDGDGVHLNAKSNAIWIAELRKKIAEIRTQR
jgi:lysophospholipase L1-like esterase